MSLTELAFIMFFILLLTAFWKMSDVKADNEELVQKNEELKKQNEELTDNLAIITNTINKNEIDLDAMFNELRKAKQTANKLEEMNEMWSSLVEDNQSIDDVRETIAQHKKAVDVLDEHGIEGTLSEAIEKLSAKNEELVAEFATVQGELSSLEKENKTLSQERNDIKGQNANLRLKLEKEGNGLEHPACWSDVNGKAQYVYNIILNENSIEVDAGWGEERKQQATSNKNIMKSIGVYSSKSALWRATNAIYKESVKNECRHMVRVYDHTETKEVYKSFLGAVENHFYKWVSNKSYDSK
jgi:FtsZ-binding cell division protein ZapB